jgi:Ca2+-transporting ATPase
VGEDQYDLAVATTMGLTAISLLHIVAAVEWRDPVRTIFSRDTLANGRFVRLVLVTIALTFIVTAISGLQRVFDTVELTATQWGICLLAPLGYLVLAEIEKLVVRRRSTVPAAAPTKG